MSHLVRHDPSEKPFEVVAMSQREAGDPVGEDVGATRLARGPAEHGVGQAFRSDLLHRHVTGEQLHPHMQPGSADVVLATGPDGADTGPGIDPRHLGLGR